MNKRVSIFEISHGNVEDKGEGHFIHASNVTRAYAEFADIEVYEYSTDDKTVVSDGVTYHHLAVRPNDPSRPNKLAKFLTFDPFGLMREQYYSFKYLWNRRESIKKADYVLLQGCLLVAGFAVAKILRKRIIIDTHWINTDVAKSKKNISAFSYYLRLSTWWLIESIMFKLSYQLLLVSKKDAVSVRKIFGTPDTKLLVIPQVIDFSAYNDPHEILKSPGFDYRVAFIGTLWSLQNQVALKFIQTELATKLPNVAFYIFGAAADKIENNIFYMKSRSNITFYLEQCDVLISPVDVGSGTKFKMLDYLYANRSIVATPPNFDGLPDISNLRGVNMVELEKFVTVIPEAAKTVLEQPSGQKQRRFVLAHHDLPVLSAQLQKGII